MLHHGYIVEQTLFCVWLVCIFIANLYYMFFRPGAEKNNELARWFYRMVLALCIINFAYCWDFRSIHGLLPHQAGIWLLATCTNIIFTGISMYLYITLRTLYQTAGKKIGGLAEEDERRVRRSRSALTVVCLLLYAASYARCVLLVLTDNIRYDSYFLWYLDLGIILIVAVFWFSSKRLAYALQLHSQSFDLSPQLKRLNLIVHVILGLTVGVVVSVFAAALFFFLENKPWGETHPDRYNFADFMDGILYFVILVMMTAGIIAPYKGKRHADAPSKSSSERDVRHQRARTVSRFNKPASMGGSTTDERENSGADSGVPMADLNAVEHSTTANLTASASSSSEAALNKNHEQSESPQQDHCVQVPSIDETSQA